ncbi:hypothetical protein, partial [Streptomyces shenzhenensis]
MRPSRPGLPDSVRPGGGPTDLGAVREVSHAISAAHLFLCLAPERAQEAAELGVTDRGPAYLAFRSAAMGSVPWQVTLAAFYSFSPRAVRAMAGGWDAAPPERWQAARFPAAGRAMRRVGVRSTAGRLAEARSLIDPVVAGADYAGKVPAAANASVALPSDPLVALWQQITVAREWRGDAHLVVLADNGLGPCDCLVLHTATGRLPTTLARATFAGSGAICRRSSACRRSCAAPSWLVAPPSSRLRSNRATLTAAEPHVDTAPRPFGAPRVATYSWTDVELRAAARVIAGRVAPRGRLPVPV